MNPRRNLARFLLFLVVGALAISLPASGMTITKCQLPDGRLYFGPSPPSGCVKLAEYKNGKLVQSGAGSGASEAVPTPDTDGGESDHTSR